jgi:hypothetical protein
MNRITLTEPKQTQDVRKLCKHAEREHESKKLAVLIERVKRQLAARRASSDPRVA